MIFNKKQFAVPSFFHTFFSGLAAVITGRSRDIRQRSQWTRQEVGLPQLLREKNGKLKCTVCLACEKKCPTSCIKIIKEKKVLVRFELEWKRCLVCGICEKCCLDNAIHLPSIDQVHVFEGISAEKLDLTQTSS